MIEGGTAAEGTVEGHQDIVDGDAAVGIGIARWAYRQVRVP